MIHPTEEFTSLTNAEKNLRKLIRTLPNLPNGTAEYDMKIRSYILLAHSVLEDYLEQISIRSVETSLELAQRDGRVNLFLMATLSHYQCDFGKLYDTFCGPYYFSSQFNSVARQAFEKHVEAVEQNHGIRKNHQNRLFRPLGLDVSSLDWQLSNALENFGKTRGGYAHSFGIRFQGSRSSVKTEFQNLVSMLKLFDLKICRSHKLVLGQI